MVNNNQFCYKYASISSAASEKDLQQINVDEKYDMNNSFGLKNERFCHAGTTVGNFFCIFGGFYRSVVNSKLEILNFDNLEWQEVTAKTQSDKNNEWPNGRIGHTMIAYTWSADLFKKLYEIDEPLAEKRNCFLLFGGVGSSEYYDDVWSFTPFFLLWKKLPAQYKPENLSRSGHTAIIHNDILIIHGGSRYPNIMSDTCLFDLKNFFWMQHRTYFRERAISDISNQSVISKNKNLNLSTASTSFPSVKRGWHIAALYNDCMYIHGGCDVSVTFDDIAKFDLKNSKWVNIKTYGKAPLKRCRHVGVVVGSRWIIHGGRELHGEVRSDIYEFCFLTLTWTAILVDQSQNLASLGYIYPSSKIYKGSINIPSRYMRGSWYWSSDEKSIASIEKKSNVQLQTDLIMPLYCHSAGYNEYHRCIGLFGGRKSSAQSSADVVLIHYKPYLTENRDDWKSLKIFLTLNADPLMYLLFEYL